MAKEYSNELKGALFKVDPEKRKNDDWAEYSGHVTVRGQKYYLDAWVKTAESTGKKFFSLRLKPANGGSERKVDSAKDDFSPL